MKARFKPFLLLLGLLLTFTVKAQFDPGSVCRVANGKLVITLDKNWTELQRAEILKLFNLDSTLFNRAFQGSALLSPDSSQWQVKKVNPGKVEISKPLVTAPLFTDPQDVLLIDNDWIRAAIALHPEEAIYGVNKLSFPAAFDYKNGVAHFYLPGNKKAGKVYICGSFNDWSTMLTPMQPVDSGWILPVNLQPGKYSYKYITDGKWMPDPSNKLKEDDTYGSHNSIVFCPNHTFSLQGYTSARTVVVCGSFNNWNEKELKMDRTPSGWELPVYLREGTHAYKFRIDREWITDPANKVTRPDGGGNLNSFIAIGDTVMFSLRGFETARQVILSGSFNAWNTNELLMDKTASGWSLPYVLAKGNYEYKFIVDGKWMTDPANPFSTGSGETENSFYSFRPNHTFELDSFPDAKRVIVSGSFNGWSTENYRMSRSNGKWTFSLRLEPGKHSYKFIVDGQWMLDPRNELWEENEYSTHNSILWIER